MNVVFRADASLEIGTGHVMRCLSLADAVRTQGAHCRFICRAQAGHLEEVIRSRGYAVSLLPLPTDIQDLALKSDRPMPYAQWLGVSWQDDLTQTLAAFAETDDCDWLVVDHYALDSNWERRMREVSRHLMVIDDLADRPHDCDLLVDQNLGRVPADYVNYVPATCKILTGSQYALLNPEFARLRARSLGRRDGVTDVQHLLISLGGVDKDNATGNVLAALQPCDLPINCRITVVMGPSAPWLNSVRSQAASMPWPTRVLVNVKTMAQLMLESDLAIGAAGTTSWERCCMGLPAVVIALAENQYCGAAALARAGAVVSMGAKVGLSSGLLANALSQARSSIQTLARNAAALCDGTGADLLISYLKGRYTV